MTNLEIILTIVLFVSLMLNLGLVYYVRTAIVRLLSISEEMYDFKEMVDNFANHLERVYELEMFYGDETLGGLMEHARSFNEQLETFEYIYGLIEEDVSGEVDEMDLLYDILEENNSEINLVRYTTSEINSLFKEVNYNLKDVRENKLVKPIDIGLLPNEINDISSSKKKKDMFIKIILPLIVKENTKIRIDRKRLFTILNKSSNTDIEKKWLEKKFKQYGVRQNDFSSLKVRMDEIPASLAIAQAAKETGWGTSRFARKGNALFGQWTWSGEGLKPKEAEKGETHKVMKFNSLQLSVRAYLRNLNTHKSYINLRKARSELRSNDKPLDSLILSKHLDKYAETGSQYIEVIQKIINQNKLKDFDEARLLPSSKDLESLI